MSTHNVHGSGSAPDSARAFLKDPRDASSTSVDRQAQAQAEGFVAAATSGDEQMDDDQDDGATGLLFDLAAEEQREDETQDEEED